MAKRSNKHQPDSGNLTKQKELAVISPGSVLPSYYSDTDNNPNNDINKISLANDGTYNIFAQINDYKAEVVVKVDKTAPTVAFSPNGGNTYINPRTRKLIEPITITANDSLSGVNKTEYIISTSATAPAANDANWATYNNPIDEIPNAEDGQTYYIYAKATDNVGNVDIIKSQGYAVIEARATFMPGTDVNIKMKTLAGNTGTIDSETEDELITKIELNSSLPSEYRTDANKVSTADSKLPIYMWAVDDPDNTGKKIIKWFTDDPHPYMNEIANNMFRQLTKLETIPELNIIDTSKARKMGYIFYRDMSLTELDVSKFDTSKVTSFRNTFNGCSGLTSLDVSKFDTSNATDMLGMFFYCSNLTSLDVSKFNTSKVTSMLEMFYNCNKLTSLDVSKFDTNKVTSMQLMFAYCSGLTNIDVSYFDTSNVTSMRSMFHNCSGLTELDLSSFDTSKVTSMWHMFNACSNLTTIYASDKFVTTALTDEAIEDRPEGNNNNTHLFDGCTKLVGGSGTAYSAEHVNADYVRIDGLNGLPGYFTNHYFIEFNANTENVQGTMTNQGIPFSYATNLKENGFTKEGYIFRGWATSPNGPVVYENGASMNYDLDGIKAVVTDAQDKADDKNVTLKLYAVWSVKHYEVTYGSPAITKPAETLVEAMSLAQDNATIKVTLGFEDTSVTDANNAAQGVLVNKNVTIDTNGKELIMANTITVAANKTVTFVDTAETKGKLKRTTGKLISNNGTVKVGTNNNNGAYMDSTDRLIEGGDVEVNSGKLTVTGASELTTNFVVIWSTNVTIKGGEIINDFKHYGILGLNSINITGGIIRAQWGIHNGSQNSTLNISGDAQVIGTKFGIISYAYKANITMTGGTVTGGDNGIYIYANLNTINIKDGTVIGANSGIRVRAESSGHTITIGDNTTALVKTKPIIQGTNDYSLDINSTTTTFNYYDGTLIGANHDKTYDGRDVTFNVADDTTVNPLTGYKPFTRLNSTTNKYETVLEKEITVTADANNGAISATNGWTLAQDGKTATKTVLQNTPYGTLPTKNEMERTGYTFKGWNTASTGGTEVDASTPVTSGTDHKIYANWQANPYTVTLNAGDYGTINEAEGWNREQDNKTATKDITYDGTYGTLPTASRPGYNFDGWFTEATGGTEVKADTIMQTAGSVTLYPHWTARTDTPYVVNYYTHDLGAATYTLKTELTKNLQGTSDSEIEINPLKETIAGHTFQAAYITGDTTKPSSGEVTSTTVAADGTRVINMYYRPNYLYVQYNMNGGSMDPIHGDKYGNSGDLVTYTNNTIHTDFRRGVYGEIVGSINNQTYTMYKDGLDNYNNEEHINIIKTGYNAKSGKEWNTKADGTGTSYNQDGIKYKAIDMATACGKDLSTGDQVITLYVNWEPTPYTITYELDGGTNNAQNPTTYTIESADITLQDPTKAGYIFRGWTGNGTTTPTKNLVLPHGSTEDKTYTANWSQTHYNVTYGSPAITKPAETLEEAISIAEAGIDGTTVTTATITATGDYNDNSTATISKNIVIDLAGHTITRTSAITNNGTLDIYSSEDNGKIIASSRSVIENNGTFTTNSTSAAHTLSLISTTTKDESYIINGRNGEGNNTINQNTTLEFTNAIASGTAMRYIIITKGITTINGATLKATSTGTEQERGIAIPAAGPNGRIIINDGTTINTTGRALYNNGSTSTGETPAIEVNGSNTSITTSMAAIYNAKNGEIKINAGNITSTSSCGIYNHAEGIINVNGGTITASNDSGIQNNSNGTINITGGRISGTNGIWNNANGIINVSGESTSIIGTIGQGIRGATGKVNISDGTIQGNAYGVSVISDDNNAGSIIMTGGTVTATNNALYATGNATITIGTNDGTVSKDTPKVTSTATAYNNFGVKIEENATFNFYDGIITGYDGHSLNAQESAKSDGYQVVKRTADGKETAVLEKEITVTAEAGDGTISATDGWTIAQDGKTATKKVLQNTPYGTLPTENEMERPGYTFSGWYTASTGGTEVDASTPVTSDTDHKIYANWTANPYTVTLNAGDYGTINEAEGWNREQDNKTATKDITYDGTYGTLPTASRPGYDFDGWFTAAAGGEQVTASSIMQTANAQTHYAHWTARTDTPYVVNYYTHNLGAAKYTLKTELTKNLQGTSDSAIEINPLKETITGHTFEAAYITGDTTKPSSGEVTTTTVAADGTRVINMYYRPNYLYVQYNMNGGSLSSSHGANYSTSGDLVTYTGNTISTNFLRGIYGGYVGGVNTNTYAVDTAGLHNWNNANSMKVVKTGYNAKSKKEWNTTAEGNGTSYNHAGGTYNAVAMATACGKDLSSGDQVITLYVNWEPTPYTIIYELDGGTNNAQNPTTYTIESADITLQDPTKAGYIFRGWTGNGTTTPTKNLVLPHGSTENKTYTANWTANQYTIAYNGNGSTGGSTASQTATYDQDITLNANGFARTYAVHYNVNGGNAIADATATYTFAGWKLNNAGDLIENQATVKNLATTGTATLYAQWNAGSVTLPDATRTGYTFAGWFKDEEFTQSTGTVGAAFTPTAETTLYGKWTANSYTVTADANGGTIPETSDWTGTGATATKSVKYDRQYGALPTPTRSGYTFIGWTGKNLFNIENAVNDYYIKKSNGQAISYISSSTTWSCSDYIEIEGGKTYTFNPNSTAGSSDTAHALYDANKAFISAVSTGKQTITTPSNAKYIRVSYRRSNSSNIQLEEGSEATPYEPYYITSETPVTTAKDHTIYAKWIKFDLNTNDTALQPGASTTISPAGTTGATITYTGEGIRELEFESVDETVATVDENGTITAASGGASGSSTTIKIKDKATGIVIGELTIHIDNVAPTWLITVLNIT